MCTMNYRVINGDWAGTRDGDTFTCDYNGLSWTITDWVEIESDDLTQEERDRWYITDRPPTGLIYPNYEDDEPPF